MSRAPSRGLRAATLLAALAAAGAAVPRLGDVARVYFPDVSEDPNPEALSSASAVFFSSAVFQCLVRSGPRGAIMPGLARSWTVTDLEGLPGLPLDRSIEAPPEARALRWIFHLDPLARFPDGRRVTAEDVVASWQALLISSRSSYRWLLDPVVGARAYRRGEAARVDGLVPGNGTLEIRLSRPAPDLLGRLAHPALGVRAFRNGRATDLGAGPFNARSPGTLIGVNPYHLEGRPFLDGLEPVEPQAVDPALLLESGQADVAVLYGRSAGQILSAGASGIRMVRLPGWDRVYSLLWNGPPALAGGGGGIPARLRRALGRGAMVRYLFDGRGEPAASLLAGPASPAQAGPVPGGGPPADAVSLLHDGEDPAAASLASRLKAAWEELGLQVDLQALDPAELWYRLASGDYLAAVLLHHPPTADPVLGLRGTLARLGARAAPALQVLDDASRRADPAARMGGAHRAEDLLLGQGFLVPLVRVHAWLATAPSLVGVEGGPAGLLHLENAWWLPGGRSR